MVDLTLYQVHPSSQLDEAHSSKRPREHGWLEPRWNITLSTSITSMPQSMSAVSFNRVRPHTGKDLAARILHRLRGQNTYNQVTLHSAPAFKTTHSVVWPGSSS